MTSMAQNLGWLSLRPPALSGHGLVSEDSHRAALDSPTKAFGDLRKLLSV